MHPLLAYFLCFCGFSLVSAAALLYRALHLLKSKRLAIFTNVMLILHTLLVTKILLPGWNDYDEQLSTQMILELALHTKLQVLVVLYLFGMQKPQLRSLPFKLCITFPASFYIGMSFFSLGVQLLVAGSHLLSLVLPSAVVSMLSFVHTHEFKLVISFAAAVWGFYLSLVPPEFIRERVLIDVDVYRQMNAKHNFAETIRVPRVLVDPNTASPSRVLSPSKTPSDAKLVRDAVQHTTTSSRLFGAQRDTLNIFQITDAHLGPFMSPKKLKKVCQNIVDNRDLIDLVLITGDMQTMESNHTPGALAEALAPLRDFKQGQVVACMGNHDYEAHAEIVRALEMNGATVLQDEQAIVSIEGHHRFPVVQIIGSVFHWGNAEQKRVHLAKLLKKYPAQPAPISSSSIGKAGGELCPRILLLHNPGDFQFLPDTEQVDITLSGHLHGGQLGIPLVFFDRHLTIVNLFSTLLNLIVKEKKDFPDQGLYRRNDNLLYSHRGTGHYGFPLRLGVPAEHSLICIGRSA